LDESSEQFCVLDFVKQRSPAGAMEVLKHRKSFLRPVEIQGVSLNIGLPEFSMTAWVRLSRQFVSVGFHTSLDSLL
jgi:hypothetical protein